MSIENGSASSSSILRRSKAAASHREGRYGNDDNPPPDRPPASGAPSRHHVGTAPVIRGAFQRPAESAVPPNDFLHQLQREKRRAERSKAALSIVLYRIDAMPENVDLHVYRLVEVLHRVKRETDILGFVGNDLVAVLCPDTGEQGTQAFLQKIRAQSEAATLPFVPVSATYPDVVFDVLVNGRRKLPEVAPLLLADTPGAGSPGYPLKRLLDMVGALIAICLFAPLMLGVAVAVAASSPGRVIFRQIRLGKGGKPFVFYKFRSMRPDADDGIHREFVANLIRGEPGGAPAPEARPLYKIASDPRVTRIGRFIRKTSIDELPQLFNVLKGDMSLTGPRPPIPYETASYQAWHLRRVLSMRPGITGLWQVEGRSKVSFDEMVRMDLRYIHQCSFWLDIRILLKTIQVVLRCEGAT